jgi:chitin synthase
MYRLKSPGRKSIPLLMDDNVIASYEENNVDTLHKKNLLSLGEDRYLTTLMLKTFPDLRTKFTSDATCRTIVPDQFAVLLSQRRRWINSTIHNLWELLLIPQLCGCLCFSMRFVVFLDLFGTLTMPGTLAYLVYLIYKASSENDESQITMSLILFGAVYGCQVFIFMLRRKWDMIMWMVIYILSLPVYGVALPLYSFWHL